MLELSEYLTTQEQQANALRASVDQSAVNAVIGVMRTTYPGLTEDMLKSNTNTANLIVLGTLQVSRKMQEEVTLAPDYYHQSKANMNALAWDIARTQVGKIVSESEPINQQINQGAPVSDPESVLAAVSKQETRNRTIKTHYETKQTLDSLYNLAAQDVKNGIPFDETEFAHAMRYLKYSASKMVRLGYDMDALFKVDKRSIIREGR